MNKRNILLFLSLVIALGLILTVSILTKKPDVQALSLYCPDQECTYNPLTKLGKECKANPTTSTTTTCDASGVCAVFQTGSCNYICNCCNLEDGPKCPKISLGGAEPTSGGGGSAPSVDLTVATDDTNYYQSLSGTAPLNGVDLKAVVSGGTGNIDYNFDCNNDGIYEATYLNASSTTKKARDLCNYTIAGTYTALVFITQGGVNAHDSATITVTGASSTPTPSPNVAPVVSNITITNPNYCVSGPGDTVGWTYTDANDLPPGADAQSAFQVQTDSQGGSFSPPLADSNKVSSNGTAYVIPQGILQYSITYKARVRVWDSKDLASAWTTSSSWKTVQHPYPQVNFSWLPAQPSVKQNVQFSDQSVCYKDASSQEVCQSWLWTFGDGGSSVLQNPAHTYLLKGNYNATLQVTDKDANVCSVSKLVNVSTTIPTWKEVSPQ